MARASKTTPDTTKRAVESMPKPRLGRPLGSKNRPKSPAAAAKAAPITRTTHAAPRKTPASAVSKSSKAELEQQVAKLERTIARLRKQNAELKQAAREEAVSGPVARTGRAAKRAAAPATRHGARASVETVTEAPAASAAAKRISRRGTKSKPLQAAEPEVAQDNASPDDHEDEAAAEE